jgi:hypothetical protein
MITYAKAFCTCFHYERETVSSPQKTFKSLSHNTELVVDFPHESEKKTRIIDHSLECAIQKVLCNVTSKTKHKKKRPIEKNLCEIQWNKNENTESEKIL